MNENDTVTKKVIMMIAPNVRLIFLGVPYLESDRVIACKLDKIAHLDDLEAVERYVYKGEL